MSHVPTVAAWMFQESSVGWDPVSLWRQMGVLAKIVVVKKPATKARKGINPFTKEPTIFKAKPARKVVRVRPLRALKNFAQ